MTIEIADTPPVARCLMCDGVVPFEFVQWSPEINASGQTLLLAPLCAECMQENDSLTGMQH